MNFLLPITRLLVLPALLLAGSVFLAEFIPQLPQAWMPLVRSLPYVTLGATILLCLQFNQSRMLFTAFCLLGFYGLLHLKVFALDDGLSNVVVSWMLLDLAVLGLLRERSIVSVHSAVKLAVLFCQVGLSWYLLVNYADRLETVFGLQWVQLPGELFSEASQLILAIAVLGMLGLLVRMVLQPGPVEAATLILFLAFAWLAHGSFREWPAVAMLAMAGLVCFLAVLFDSHKMAYRDELTGLRSRRALNQYLTGLGRKYTIAMMDIDHFKKFNDTHGHDVGDQMLKLVASKIGKVTGGGTSFRYGGEEFTVVFPRREVEDVKAHLEALREAIEGYPLVLRASDRPKKAPSKKSPKKKQAKKPKTLSCTISIGVASRNDKMKTPEEVIKGADKALYRAKKKGRNNVST